MADPALIPVRRALLSVYDKSGIVDLARALAARGIEIVSTGGSARLIAEHGVPVREVAAYTGFPEIMDGRVKTLHPRIHGGLLGRRGTDDAAMASNGIEPIDLLVANLYPFAATIARPDCRYSEAIEHIDIGGPAMIRAAAKNHDFVTVVVEPEDYTLVMEELRTHDGSTTFATRARLAAKAFAHTALYDTMVASYLADRHLAQNGRFAETLPLVWAKVQDLRYGENPHQRAAFYRDPSVNGACIASARALQGKDLSFNNISDADAAIECVRQFAEPACVIVKHANPCGAAIAASALDAYESAYRTDPTSAFGGIIAFNRELDGRTAETIVSRQFAEVIAAPAVSVQAAAALATKPGVRVLALGDLRNEPAAALEYRSVTGGLLVQSRDTDRLVASDLTVATRRAPTQEELRDLLFAWRICRFVKSNAIVYAREGATIGVGAGQTSRVHACRMAGMKAADEKLPTAGAVLASDAFIPFRDTLDVAAEHGIRAVIQPGGSKRDAEAAAAADEHGMAMVLTGTRHFRH